MEEKKNKFVTVEGVDGVGKTEIAKKLASGGDFVMYKGPSGPYKERRAYIDEHATPQERWEFYREANEYDAEEIRKLLEVSNVVADRYINSTRAYHEVMDPTIKQLHTPQEGILLPDHSFLITTDPDERDRRLIERGEPTNSEFLNQVADRFLEIDPEMIEIDTTNIDAKTAAGLVRDIMGLYPDNKEKD